MKTTLHLKAKKISSLFALLKQTNLLIVFAFLMFLQTGFAQQATISPWKINKGEGIINASIGFHGNPIAYDFATIPSTSDSNWTPAPVNANGEINYSVQSILSFCLQQLDFTYFETFIQIPSNFSISDLKVSFSAADDGARAYIFNSDHPNGAYIGEIRLGQTAITANYAQLAKAGESNRLVIVQFDDCPSGNNLTGAQVQVNGVAAPINTPPIANAGADQLINCALLTGNSFSLNGSASTDANNDALTYNWSENGITLATGVNPTVSLTSGVHNITLTVNDSKGGSNQDMVLITANGDNTAPNITLNGNASQTINSGTTFTDAGATATDNCSTATVIVGGTVNTNLPGVYTLTYDATDAIGNVATQKTRTITVVDKTPPTVVTQNITVYLDVNGQVSITPAQIDNGSSDNSGSITLSLDAGQGHFTCANIGVVNTVNLVVTDAQGNSAYAPAIVTVQDNIAPTVVTQDFQLDLDEEGNASIIASQIDNGSSDSCGVASVTVSPDTFNCSNIGSNTVTLTVTDNHGNIATGTALVTITDNIAPTVVTQNVTVYLDANGQGAVTAAQIENGSTDACGIDATSFGLSATAPRGSVVMDVTNITCSDIGTHNVTLSVADVYGNTATAPATVTVVDTIAPVIVAPADISVVATSASGAVVNYVAPIGTDNCSVSTVLTAGLASGSVFPIGITVVTYTATDASNNTSSASFNVTVVGIAPAIVCPGDITVNNDLGQCGALVNYAATETVGIPASVITYDIAPGSSFAVGTTTVTATATNAVGTSSCTFTVTVVDTIAPVIVAPADISVFATSASGAVVNYVAPIGTDNCSVSTVLTAGLASGSVFPIGITVVTYTATDASNNTSSTSFNVTVVGIAPAIVCPGDITVSNDLGQCGALVNYAATETVGIPASVITYDIAPGSSFAVGTTTVTATATNAVGTSSCTFTVTVNDNEAPNVITQPVTTTITNGVATITADQVNNGSTDNCGIASVEVSPNTFVCGDQGDHTVTLTVTDIHGNSATQTAVVTVLGDVPSISVNTFTAVPTQAANTIFLGYGPQSITLNTVATGGTGFSYSWTSSTGELVASEANPTVSPKLSTTYTVTVTNANGCTATATIYVCVIDARSIEKNGEYEGKVLVCHHEGGNDGDDEHHNGSSAYHTIEISQNAVEKHLSRHGDTLGACGGTCSTTYVEVVVENDDDDDHDSHADNDDDDDDHDSHADNDDDDDDHDDKGDHSDDDDHHSKSKNSETKAVVYPNPVGDDFVVGLNKKGKGSVEIYDNKGNRIYKKDSKDLKGGIAFNMRGKKAGTYFARVTCKGKVYTATIFKKE